MFTNCKVPPTIKSLPTAQLVEIFIETGRQEPAKEVYVVRGWIMAELEARNPGAFDAWLDLEDCTDEALLQMFPC